MRKKPLAICIGMSLLAVSGCSSPQPVAIIPPPPAWLMQEPPELLQMLNGIISVSEPESKPSQSN